METNILTRGKELLKTADSEHVRLAYVIKVIKRKTSFFVVILLQCYSRTAIIIVNWFIIEIVHVKNGYRYSESFVNGYGPFVNVGRR